MRKLYTDQQLIEAIKQGGNAMEAAISYLYYQEEYRKFFVAIAKSSNGIEADVADIFQEGLFILIQKIQQGAFRGESTIKTYFIGICKHIWLSKNSKEKRRKEIRLGLKQATITAETNESLLLLKERETMFQEIFSQLGEGCKKVLALIKLGYKAKEIAKMTDYKNEEVIKKKKSVCLRKLRLFLLNRPDLVAILTNKE